MDIATLVSLVIAIVGIALQLIDAFPEHREARRAAALIAVGVFIGLSAGSLGRAQWNITGEISGGFALLFSLAVLAGLFAAASIIVGDEGRRTAAQAAAGCALGAFLLTGFVVGLGSARSNDAQSLSTDERGALAALAERQGRYDRAIEHLRALEFSLGSDGAQRAVEERINNLEAAQARPSDIINTR